MGSDSCTWAEPERGAAAAAPRSPVGYRTRNENGAEAVLDFDLTVIVPRTVFDALGAVSRHVAVPDVSCPAQRFVAVPILAVQRTVPVAIGAFVST